MRRGRRQRREFVRLAALTLTYAVGVAPAFLGLVLSAAMYNPWTVGPDHLLYPVELKFSLAVAAIAGAVAAVPGGVLAALLLAIRWFGGPLTFDTLVTVVSAASGALAMIVVAVLFPSSDLIGAGVLIGAAATGVAAVLFALRGPLGVAALGVRRPFDGIADGVTTPPHPLG